MRYKTKQHAVAPLRYKNIKKEKGCIADPSTTNTIVAMLNDIRNTLNKIAQKVSGNYLL